MIINELSLRNFRNYKELKISFNKGTTILFGKNGAGKTSILEAIYLCTTGKSFKTNKDDEIVKDSCNEYKIELNITVNNYERKIDISWDKLKGKTINVNDIKLKRNGDLMGMCKTVIFAPEDLFIIKGVPANRRRFIDISICQVNPLYFFELQKYHKIVKQRNCILKEISGGKNEYKTLEVWDKIFAETAANIVKSRLDYIGKANNYYNIRHKDLTKKEENFVVKYKNDLFNNNMNLFEIEETISKSLKRNYKRDLLTLSTNEGPHRDDYSFLLGTNDLKSKGSQGQIKTAAIALKLGELDMLKNVTKEEPIILLDDVLSELDDERKRFLVNAQIDIQTIITSASKNTIRSLPRDNTSLYLIDSGKLIIS